MQNPSSNKPSGARDPQQSDFDDSDWSRDAEVPIRQLTREEAQALLAKQKTLTVWQVLLIQAGFGLLVALIWGALSQRSSAFWSSLYAMAVVVVPGLLMARGVFGRNAGRGVGGLLFWEILKLGLSGALLVLAPVVVRPLDWAALLVTLVLCLKVIGVVLLFGQGRKKNFV
ncbi:MAG TPA: ATP synthase subunit I [Aquabacterium sp.]|nr:ATP synthase subunit I [Aquabacterium sp.]